MWLSSSPCQPDWTACQIQEVLKQFCDRHKLAAGTCQTVSQKLAAMSPYSRPTCRTRLADSLSWWVQGPSCKLSAGVLRTFDDMKFSAIFCEAAGAVASILRAATTICKPKDSVGATGQFQGPLCTPGRSGQYTIMQPHVSQLYRI